MADASLEGTGTVVNCTFHNVRAQPNNNAAAVGGLAVGDVVSVEERFGSIGRHWYQIQVGDTIGWVFSRYLHVN